MDNRITWELTVDNSGHVVETRLQTIHKIGLQKKHSIVDWALSLIGGLILDLLFGEECIAKPLQEALSCIQLQTATAKWNRQHDHMHR